MSVISVRLNDEEREVLENAARFYRCNLSTLIKRLTFEKLEDEYDMKAASDYLKERGWNTGTQRFR